MTAPKPTSSSRPPCCAPPSERNCGLLQTLACLLCTLVMGLLVPPEATAQSKDPTDAGNASANAGNDGFFRQVELKALPFATYSPDTSFAAGGVGLMHFDMPGESGNQSSINALGIYTLNNQMTGRLQWELAFEDEAWLFRGKAKGGLWPDDYHGVGPHAPADGEGYESTFFESTVGVRRELEAVPRLYVGLLHDFQSRSVTPTPGGMLANQQPVGHTGGTVSGLGAEVVLDHRDSKYSPHEGVYAQGRLTWYTPLLGSDYGYLEFTGDARRYWDLGNGHSIGVRGLFELQSGRVPFFEMASLGGSKLNRGINGNRFRDHAILASQVEYRSPMFWRFGFSTFASLGTIGPSLGDLFSSRPRWSAGAGLRFFVDTERRLPLRLDFGFSEDQLAPDIYFSIGEAF